MILKEDCMKLAIKKFPEFQESWQRHLKYWGNDERGLCTDMSEFSQFTTDLIIQNKVKTLPEIFDFIESLIVEGDKDVKNAAATCFLENLLNVTPHEISASSFVHLLGHESRDYCKAWDKFTGVQTVGL